MKKMYCMKCGLEIHVKFGMVPNSCTCGAEFREWNKDTVKNTVVCIITLLLLMSPLFVIVFFARKNSSRFYTFVCNHAGCFYHLFPSGGGEFDPDWDIENK